jgi:hypothetical protein
MDRGPKYGSYCLTAARVTAGWGVVAEQRWRYPHGPVVWPPIEPPGLDRIARFNRTFAHFRARTMEDLKRAIAAESPVNFSVPITRSWRTAPNGVIPMPVSPAEFTEGHSVLGIGYNDGNNYLQFMNCWGKRWGRDGIGFLPYEYFDQYVSDAWFLWPTVVANWKPTKLGDFTAPLLPTIGAPFSGQVSDIGDGFVYRLCMFGNPLGNPCAVIDIWANDDDNRIAWVIMTVRDNYLDIEDFFIKPDYAADAENVHYLLNTVDELATRETLKLRFWIAHADTHYRAANFNTINEIVRAGTLTVLPSPFTWAAYVAERLTKA